jgi:hypothetical protein
VCFVVLHCATSALNSTITPTWQVPSYGIITNGVTYSFHKYLASSKQLLSTDTIVVHLSKHSSAQTAAEQVRPVLMRLVHMLNSQKEELQRFLQRHSAKKQR